MFWSLTVSAMATALLSSGGSDALRAVQAASVVCGLPVAFILCYFMQSITHLCRAAEELDCDHEFPDQPEFKMPIYGGDFNIIDYVVSLGKVDKSRVALGMYLPTNLRLVGFLKGYLFRWFHCIRFCT